MQTWRLVLGIWYAKPKGLKVRVESSFEITEGNEHGLGSVELTRETVEI